MHNNIYKWYADEEEAKLWRPLLDKIIFEKETTNMSTNTTNPFYGKTVVATGKLENYTRDGVKTWMKKRFDEEDRAFLTADLGSAKELAQLLRQIPDERKKKALLCFHWAKYGNFNTGKLFLSQYERNLKVLREYLKEFTE